MRTLLITTILIALFVSDASALMLVSKKTEIAIGSLVRDQILTELGGQTKNLEVHNDVNALGQQLAKHAKRKDIEYKFYVVEHPMVNAMSCPGGFVIITTGLISILKDKDELAFVLGHEIAHASCQHGRKAINQELITLALSSAISPTEKEERIAGTALSLVDAGYSRKDEYEADNCGADLAIAAGFPKECGLRALSRLGLSPNPVGLDKYLASHPPTSDRIVKLGKKFGFTKEQAAQVIDQPLQ
jgi:beta-barrel assembly-enhancing protease